MCRERIIFRVAGIFILSGLALGYYVAPGWYLLSAFVGFNMLQSSFTGFCPLTMILKALKLKPCEGKASFT